MAIQHQQRAIDLGIVIQDSERSLAFYRDLLGMNHEGDMPMPIGGGGTMQRLRCGDSLIKLVCFETTPGLDPGAGGLKAELATGTSLSTWRTFTTSSLPAKQQT